MNIQDIKTALLERYKVIFLRHLSRKADMYKEMVHIEAYLIQFCGIGGAEITCIKNGIVAEFNELQEKIYAAKSEFMRLVLAHNLDRSVYGSESYKKAEAAQQVLIELGVTDAEIKAMIDTCIETAKSQKQC